MPLAVAVEGAHRHDMKLAEPTLEALMVARPQVSEEEPRNMCFDAGYDYEAIPQLLAAWG